MNAPLKKEGPGRDILKSNSIKGKIKIKRNVIKDVVVSLLLSILLLQTSCDFGNSNKENQNSQENNKKNNKVVNLSDIHDIVDVDYILNTDTESVDFNKLKQQVDKFCTENELMFSSNKDENNENIAFDYVNFGYAHVAMGENELTGSAIVTKLEEDNTNHLVNLIKDNIGQKEIIFIIEGINSSDPEIQKKFGFKNQYIPKDWASKASGVLISDEILNDQNLKFKIIGVDSRLYKENDKINIDNVMNKMFEFCNQKKVFFRLKNQTNYLDINNLDVDILKNINLGFDLIVSDDFKLEFDKFLKEEAIPSIKNNLIREDEISKTIKEEKAKNRFPISVTGCLHSQNSPNSIVLSSSPSQIQKLLRDFLYRTFFEHLIKENNHNLD